MREGNCEKNSLVSVGVPTYNRPDGLRRTLECILHQTHTNIEVIISDNCSPDCGVFKVANEFICSDSRISYYKQNVKINIDKNFKYVLSKASGEYFMWASDDDEWEPDFIKSCVKNISTEKEIVSSMPNFKIKNRYHNTVEKGEIPNFSIYKTRKENVLAFLNCVTPSLFYGVHKREAITFVLEEKFFDFYDCYFILRILLKGQVAIEDKVLYTAGIDSENYSIKAQNTNKHMKLNYAPFYFESSKQVLQAKINILDKLHILMKLLYVSITFFWFHEIKK